MAFFKTIKTLELRPAVVGRIKIGKLGEKRQSQGGRDYQMPVKLDHFLVTGMDRGSDGNFVPDPDIMSQIGFECREIDVQLLDDSIESVFPHSLNYFAGKTCLCRGDGERAERREFLLKAYGDEVQQTPMVPPEALKPLLERMKSNEYGGWMETVCPPETCRFFNVADEKKPRCKAVGRLYVTLPNYRPMLGGVYVFVTTSAEGIRSIAYTLQDISQRTGGILEGIPLKLKLYPKVDTAPDGKQIKSWKVGLLFDPGKEMAIAALGTAARTVALARCASLVDLREVRAQQRVALAAEDAKLLEVIETEPVDENDDEEEGCGAPDTSGFAGDAPEATAAAPEKPAPAATPSAPEKPAAAAEPGPSSPGLPGLGS